MIHRLGVLFALSALLAIAATGTLHATPQLERAVSVSAPADVIRSVSATTETVWSRQSARRGDLPGGARTARDLGAVVAVLVALLLLKARLRPAAGLRPIAVGEPATGYGTGWAVRGPPRCVLSAA